MAQQQPSSALEALDQRRQVIAVDLSKLEKQVASFPVQLGHRGKRLRVPDSSAALSPLLYRRFTSLSRCISRRTTQTLETSSRRADAAGASSPALLPTLPSPPSPSTLP